MILITESAVIILLLTGILFFIYRIYIHTTQQSAEMPEKFTLAKHCDKDKLHAECIKRGLTEYDFTLLCARYVDCLNSAQLEIKFNQSSRNVRRLIRKAELKFNTLQ